MSQILPAAPITDAQKVDVRRFLGYPLYCTGDVIFPYPWIMRYYLALETRLNSMTASEVTVLTTIYLANLYTLEAAIPLASANLATDQAAVWTHNKQEVADRFDLFNRWRAYLAEFIGVPLDPHLRMRNNSMAMVV